MFLADHLFKAPAADWIFFGGFLAGITLVIMVAEKLRHVRGFSPEVNRKLVHILTGVLIFFTPFLFVSNRPLVLMAVLFVAVNYIGIRTGKLKSMHGTSRISYGTVFYPLTFFLLALTCWSDHKVILILSMLIMGLADAAAAIVGENLKHPHDYYLGKDKKSVEGSLVMFLSSFLLVAVLLPRFDYLDAIHVGFGQALWIALLTAIIATVLEALSSGGSDNISAPLGAAFVMHSMLTHPVVTNLQLTIGVGLALVVAFLSYKARLLTASGSAATFLLAAVIFGIGGWAWSIPILTFFILSSLLSKIGKSYKSRFSLIFEKTSCRDLGQVLANGGVAGLVVVLHRFWPHSLWYVVYLGALAAVTADTWATEIGVFSKSHPRSIRDFSVVEPGTSGGVTFLGTVSALAGAMTIALSGLLVTAGHPQISISATTFGMVVVCGVLASFLDSLLGATVQAQFRCPKCGKITEKKTHCQNHQTAHITGKLWLNNDWVNSFCAMGGAFFVGVGLFLSRHFI